LVENKFETHPKGQWCEYCKREERIQNYIAEKNGAPLGTFLTPPNVEDHGERAKNSFFVFTNDTQKDGAQNRFDKII